MARQFYNKRNFSTMKKEVMRDRPVMDYFKASALLLRAGLYKGLRNLFFGLMSGSKSLSVGTSVSLFLVLTLSFMGWSLIDPPQTIVTTEKTEEQIQDEQFMLQTENIKSPDYLEESSPTPLKKFTGIKQVREVVRSKTIHPSKLVPGKLSKWDSYRYNVWLISAVIIQQNNLRQSQETIYDWSMKLFFHESRHVPTIVNGIGAQGLFQAIRSTRKDLKCGNLHTKPVEKQLEYYAAYVRGVINGKPEKINNFGDWYFIGLFPKLVGKPENTVFARKGSKVYKLNNMDMNKDGIMTIKEVREEVIRRCLKHK